jgi:RHS repeat-associated protein
VEGVDHSPFEGVKVYAFDGTTYKGYSGTSGKDGQVTFTLPQGNYRFRGELNGTQFWSSAENACALPGCANAAITLPGGNTSRSAVTINYTYDGLSRLTAADFNSGDYYHYAYDSAGNRLTEATARGETAYTYDTANRLTSVNGQAVQWDDNGNMLADGQAVYTYNTANRLVGVTKGTSSIVYAYSGLGDRLKQIADGVTTDYTLDINAGLTQVLQDNTNKYVYGNSRISQTAETQTGYFLPDALGSMRQMTDPSADLTLARAYDPYGNAVSSSGAGETVYGYTGEMQSGGLVHLRARDYASQLGRFTSRDTWEMNIQRPTTHNYWIYVQNSPVNLLDPTGYSPDISSPEIDGLYLEIEQYGISLEGYWGKNAKIDQNQKRDELQAISTSLSKISTKFQNFSKSSYSKYNLFNMIYGNLIFERNGSSNKWHCDATTKGYVICEIYSGFSDFYQLEGTIAHELGHKFDTQLRINQTSLLHKNPYLNQSQIDSILDKTGPIKELSNTCIRDKEKNWVTGLEYYEDYPDRWVRGFEGYKLPRKAPNLYHGPGWGDSAVNTPMEEFADMFYNWVYDNFDYSGDAGVSRQEWMEKNMPHWIDQAITGKR